MSLALDRLRQRFPALTHRDFLIFWVGQFISLIGTWMQNTTQPYLAYKLSGSRFDLGLIGFAATFPTLLLALPGGVLIERLDKRRTVIVMQTVMMLQAFALAWLTLSGVVRIWHIVALSLVLGTANAIEITARQAMLIELVGREHLPNAIALQSTIFNAARVIGPSLMAPFLLLIRERGEGWAFLANGLSFLVVIAGLLFVRTRPVVAAPESDGRNLWSEFREGQRYIRSNRLVATLITMAAIVGFIGFPVIQQIPAVARDLLARPGDTDASVAARNSALYTAQGVGALTAALSISVNSSARNKGRRLTVGQYAFLAGMLGLAAVSRLGLAPALGLIVIMGWGAVTQLAMMNTLIQLQVPNGLRGRVFSTYLWALQGVAPAGSLLIGWLAQTRGIPFVALSCGAFCLVTFTWLHLRNPAIRRAE